MITAAHLKGFVSELEKTAGPGGMGGVLGWVPGLKGRYGWQMLAGAGVGAGAGALADKENRLRGASRGALGGAALTGLGHLTTSGGRAAAAKSISNFGARTHHAFTGGAVAPGDVHAAKKHGILSSGATKYDLEAFRKGWDTIPGLTKGTVTHPGRVLANSWNRMGTGGKVLTGLSGADVAYQAATPSEPGGQGRTERVLSSGLGSLGFMVAPAGMIPSTLVGMGTGAAGDRAGRLIDRGVSRIRGVPQAPPQTLPGTVMPNEYPASVAEQPGGG